MSLIAEELHDFILGASSQGNPNWEFGVGVPPLAITRLRFGSKVDGFCGVINRGSFSRILDA